MIRATRILEASMQREDMIYLGLMTTTAGYSYGEPISLATNLAYSLPLYKIYFPIINTWAGKDIKSIDIPSRLPSNLIIEFNPQFNDAIDNLAKSSYFVGTDNGPSHIAYHLGIPRLILDPQFNKLPWIARWREDYLESIPINTPVETVTSIVKMNLDIPQTTLIPRMVCLTYGDANWDHLLWLKSE
jgi:hypothetical protein